MCIERSIWDLYELAPALHGLSYSTMCVCFFFLVAAKSPGNTLFYSTNQRLLEKFLSIVKVTMCD